MGKYMRKAKTTGEVAVVDLSLGVRTRAKTLALQSQTRLPPSPPPPPSAQSNPAASGGYLQLRSRRLVKPPILVHDSERQKEGQHNPSPNSDAGSTVRVGPTDSQTLGSVLKEDGLDGGDKNGIIEGKKESGDNNNDDNCDSKDLIIETSFGENVLDFEGRERSTRESTPCSLIRDPETTRTPGSSTRPTGSTEANRRIENSTHRHIPTPHEMDKFFAKAEDEQHRQFIEKYNFDPVNDKPLPGRYEWEKLDP